MTGLPSFHADAAGTGAWITLLAHPHLPRLAFLLPVSPIHALLAHFHFHKDLHTIDFDYFHDKIHHFSFHHCLGMVHSNQTILSR
jgi:hypothetical protein